MSLILGINLPQYLYLVSDTRLTNRKNGVVKYQDNFCKFYCFNKNVSVVVAGHAHLASYVLNKFGKSELVNKGFLQVEAGIDEFVKMSIDKYLKEGNKYTTVEGRSKSVMLIFGGFDKSAKKQINSSHYGRTLFNTFVPGEKQTLNKEIIHGMIRVASKNGNNGQKGIIGNLKKDQIVEINHPFSSIVTVEIGLPDKLEIRKTGCYRYVMKAPNNLSENDFPKKLAYELEQEGSKHSNGEGILKFQSIMLTAWVDEIIKEHKLNTVGGSIMVNMITSEDAIIAVGAISALDGKTGQVRKVSEIIVYQGQYCVRNKNGIIVPLQNIYDFDNKGEFEL